MVSLSRCLSSPRFALRWLVVCDLTADAARSREVASDGDEDGFGQADGGMGKAWFDMNCSILG